MQTRLALTLAFALALPAAGAAQRPKHAPPKKATPTPVQPQPAPQQQPVVPTPQPTPEQGPSSPPDVTYKGGQLTILARNSTMGDVLNAVRSKTGAAVDMPASSSERVVGQFGPGAPRDVLAQLLNGSHYDYVLLGSPAEPGALKKIVLMARASGPEPAPAPAPPQNSYQPNEGLQAVPNVEQPDQATADEASPDVQPEPQPDQEEPQGEQPPVQPPNGGPVVKTPEQLLRELQQQQQQQQQQNPPQQ